LNDGNATFTLHPVNYDISPDPYHIAAGDVDGDGDIDLAVASYDSIGVSILFNQAATDSDLDGISDHLDNCPLVFNPLQEDIDSSGPGDACCCVGIRGDNNGDGSNLTVLDMTHLIDRIFRGGPPSICPVEADTNSDNTKEDVLDLTFIINKIYRGGPNPGPC
jgi:hypothetical protein